MLHYTLRKQMFYSLLLSEMQLSIFIFYKCFRQVMQSCCSRTFVPRSIANIINNSLLEEDDTRGRFGYTADHF